MKQNPGYMAKLTIMKFIKFWRLYPHTERIYNYEYSRSLLVIASLLSYGPVLLFAIIGMIVSAKLWKKEIFLYGVIISFVAVHLIFWSQIRYRLPIMPYIIIFAAYGLDLIYRRFMPINEIQANN